MTLSLDTFLVAAYYFVDDIYQEFFSRKKPIRRGACPQMSDSEVLTLFLLGQWSLHRSERWLLKYAKQNWRPFFPRILSQSAFNKRVRDLAGLTCQLAPRIAERFYRWLQTEAAYYVLDGVPVPLMHRCRGDRHRLFAEEAQVGRGGSDKEFYYGVKALVVVSSDGLCTGFVVGPANTEERWMAEALFRSRAYPQAAPPTAQEMEPVLGKTHKKGGKREGPTGPLSRLGVGEVSQGSYVGDLGFRGAEWEAHWEREYGIKMLTKEAYKNLPKEERSRARKWLSGLRQKVETVFGWLSGALGLKFPKARSYWGLLARLGAKLAAFNLARLLNRLWGNPDYSWVDPFCLEKEAA